MEHEKPKEVCEASEANKKRAQEIVSEELGKIACVYYDLFPRNVGEKGDKRVYGDSPLVVLNVDDPIAYLTDNYDKFEQLSFRLTSGIDLVTRVLIDITPKDAKPTPLNLKGPRTLSDEGKEI